MDERALRIAVDARPLTTSQAGVATYCRGLLHGFNALEPVERVLLYAKEAAPDDLTLGSSVAWRAFAAPLWLPLAVPRALAAADIDVFHGSNHMAPPFSPIPTVITVHDLSALALPEHHTWRNRLLTVPQMLLSLRRAARIIAVSQATARDVAALPGIDEGRIRVIPEAPAPDLVPANLAAIEALAARLHLPRHFVLYLGALEPRKNIATLVRAIAQLRADSDERACLVIAGASGWRNDDVGAEVRRLGLADAVRFVGYIPTSDLPALYGAATVFAYPSLFEGFGLPPLEAMVCGVPVVCSDTSSLPEVVGDAALTVDPRSADALAAALQRALHDTELRARLRAAGVVRAAQFSWARTARATLEVYREAARARRERR